MRQNVKVRNDRGAIEKGWQGIGKIKEKKKKRTSAGA